MSGSKRYELADDMQVYLWYKGQYYATTLSQVNAEDYHLIGWYDSLGCAAGGKDPRAHRCEERLNQINKQQRVSGSHRIPAAVLWFRAFIGLFPSRSSAASLRGAPCCRPWPRQGGWRWPLPPAGTARSAYPPSARPCCVRTGPYIRRGRSARGRCLRRPQARQEACTSAHPGSNSSRS